MIRKASRLTTINFKLIAVYNPPAYSCGLLSGPLANRVLEKLDTYGVSIKTMGEKNWEMREKQRLFPKTYRETLTLIFANCLKDEICDQVLGALSR